MLSTREVADKLGVSTPTIRRWVTGGLIPSFCYHQNGSGPLRFVPGAVDFFVANGAWPESARRLQTWARAS